MRFTTFRIDTLGHVQDVCSRLPDFLDQIEIDLIKDGDIARAQCRYHSAIEASQGVSGALLEAKIGREWTNGGGAPSDDILVPVEVQRAASVLANAVYMR